MSSSTGVVENGKRGLLERIERMNGFFGGWGSLLRGRTARNKRLKKEKKLARTGRLANFARDFRGRLMLEPLEERIVPASVLVGPGEFVLINFSTLGQYDPLTTDGSTYGIIANAGPGDTDNVVEAGESWFAVEVDPDLTEGPPPSGTFQELDELVRISLFTVNPTYDTHNTVILTNIRVPLLDDAYVEDTSPTTFDTVNTTFITGVDFTPEATPGTGPVEVRFGSAVFRIADDFDDNGGALWGSIAGGTVGGNFTEITAGADLNLQLDKFGEVNAHASDIDEVDLDNKGVVNLVASSSWATANTLRGWTGTQSLSSAEVAYMFPARTFGSITIPGGVAAGIDTRLAVDDYGNVGDVNVSGSLGTSLGIYVRDGSILGEVTADDMGDIVAGIDIGDNDDQSILSNNDIGRVIAGRNIDLGSDDGNIIAASGGIDLVQAGGFIYVDTISGLTGIGASPAVVALGGNIEFDQIISAEGDVGDVLASGHILVHTGDTGDILVGDADIEAAGSLGKIISGASFTAGVFDPTIAPIFGGDGGTIGTSADPVVIRAGTEGGLIQGPGGVHAVVIFGEASSASPLFQLVSGEDLNLGQIVDTGIVYTFAANFDMNNDGLIDLNDSPILPRSGPNAVPVTAAIFFAIGTTAGPHVSGITPDMAVVHLQGTDARTDLRLTTRTQTTETYIAPNSQGYYNDDPLFRTIDGVAALEDSPMLIDFAGVDVDPEIGVAGVDIDGPFFTEISGAPGVQGSLPNTVDGGTLEADVRNVLLEANLGFVDGDLNQGGALDLEVNPAGNPNQPNNIGNINTLFIVGEIVEGSQIHAESVQAYGTSWGVGGANLTAMEAALNSTVMVIQRTEAQDIIVIAQNDLPGTSIGASNPGAVLKYNTGAGFPRNFDLDLSDDYNNTLYIGAPSLAAPSSGTAVMDDIAHVYINFIDGNSDYVIQVHELPTAQNPVVALPASIPTETTTRQYHIGRLRGLSPIPSVENAGPAGIGLITTGPTGGAIGFVEWEGHVGGVETFDFGDPTHPDLPDLTIDLNRDGDTTDADEANFDEHDAYLGSLSVGVLMGAPFVDNDAFTSAVVRTSDLGYVDIDGDIGFVRPGGFGAIPTIPALNLANVVGGNLQGIFVTGSLLGTLSVDATTGIGIAVRTQDTLPIIKSHGEDLKGADAAELTSVIVFNNIEGDILVAGSIWDNIFAGYDGSGTIGLSGPGGAPTGAGLRIITISALGNIGGSIDDYAGGSTAPDPFPSPFVPPITYPYNDIPNVDPYSSYGADDTLTFLNAFEYMHNVNRLPDVGEDYVGGAEGVYARISSGASIIANIVSGWDIVSGPSAPTPSTPPPGPPPGGGLGEGHTGTIIAANHIIGDIIAGRHIIADIYATTGTIYGTIASGQVSSNSSTFPAGPGIEDTMFNPPTATDPAFFIFETEENNAPARADALTLEESFLYVMNNTSNPVIHSAFGRIGYGNFSEDVFSFVVDPAHIGQTLYITLISQRADALTGINPFLELIAPNQTTVVASSDNDSLGLDPVMAVTLTSTGVWYIRVSDFGVPDPGFNYTLDMFLLPICQLLVGSILPESGATISAGQDLRGNVVAGQTAAPAEDLVLPFIVFGDYDPVDGVFTGTPPQNFEGSVGDILNPIVITRDIDPVIVAIGGDVFKVNAGRDIINSRIQAWQYAGRGGNIGDTTPGAADPGGVNAGRDIRAADGSEGIDVSMGNRDMIIRASLAITQVTAGRDIRASDGFDIAVGAGGDLRINAGTSIGLVDANRDIRAGDAVVTSPAVWGSGKSLFITAGTTIGTIDAGNDFRAGDGGVGVVGANGGSVTVTAGTILDLVKVGRDLRAGDGGGTGGGNGGGFGIGAGTAINTIDVGRDFRAGDGGSTGGSLDINDGNIAPKTLAQLQDILAGKLGVPVPAGLKALLLQIKNAIESGSGGGDLAMQLYELIPEDVRDGFEIPYSEADGFSTGVIGPDIGAIFENIVNYVVGHGENNSGGGSTPIINHAGSPPYFRPELAGIIWDIINCAQIDSLGGGDLFGGALGAGILGGIIGGSGDTPPPAEGGNTIGLIRVGRDFRAGDGVGAGNGGSVFIGSATNINQIQVGRDLRAGLNAPALAGLGGSFVILAGGSILSVSVGDDIMGFAPGFGPFVGGSLVIATLTGGIGVIQAEDVIHNLRAFSFGTLTATSVSVIDFSTGADQNDRNGITYVDQTINTVAIPANTGIGYIISKGDADRQELSDSALSVPPAAHSFDIDVLTDPSPVAPDGDFPYTPLPPSPDQGFHGITNLVAIATGANANILQVAALNGNIDPTLILNLFGSINSVSAFSDITDTFIIAGDNVLSVTAGDDVGGEDPYADGVLDTVIISGLDSLWAPDGVGGIGVVQAGDEVRDILILALENIAGTAIGSVVAKGIGSTVPAPDFPDYYLGPFGWVSTLHGIDTALIIGNGNINLVDAEVGDIINTAVIAYGSSIGRIHAGNDIGGDLLFSGVFAPVIAIATDHIFEVAAGDDINTFAALTDFVFGLRDLPSEDDTIGGFGIMEAGDSIELVAILSEGHFGAAAKTVAGLTGSVRGTFALGAETSIGAVRALGLADTNLDSIDAGSIFIFAAVADGKIGEVYSYDNISLFAIHSDQGAGDPVTQFNPLAPFSFMTGDDFLNNVDNAEVSGGGLGLLEAETGNIAFGEVLVIKGNIGTIGDSTPDIIAGQSIINVPIAALRAGPLPFAGGKIGIIQTGEDLINPEIFAGHSLDGIHVGRDLIDGDPFIDIESEDLSGDIGFIEVGRDIRAPGIGTGIIYDLTPFVGDDIFIVKSDFGSIGRVNVGRDISDTLLFTVFAAYVDINEVIAGRAIQDTLIVALTGDVDEVSALGSPALGFGVNAIVWAGGVVPDSTLFLSRIGPDITTTFTTYSIEVDGAFTTAQLFYAAGTPFGIPFGAMPDVALLGVTGTDDTTSIQFNTTGAALWDLIAFDVDPIINTPLSPLVALFLSPEDLDIADLFSPVLGMNLPVAPDGGNEANLKELRVEGNIGVFDGILSFISGTPFLPAVIDIDDGLAPDNLGDMGYLYWEGTILGALPNLYIEVESVGVIGFSDPLLVTTMDRGALDDLFIGIGFLHHAEFTFTGVIAPTDVDSIHISDPAGAIPIIGLLPSAYFFTVADSPFGAFGDVFYLTAGDAKEARGTVAGIDGSVGHGNDYPIGAINTTNAWLFEATQSVSSYTDTGSGDFSIEIEGSLGALNVLADIVSDPTATRRLEHVHTGFFIGYTLLSGPIGLFNKPLVGAADPVVPASFIADPYTGDDLFPEIVSVLDLLDLVVEHQFTTLINPGPDLIFGTADDFIIHGANPGGADASLGATVVQGPVAPVIPPDSLAGLEDFLDISVAGTGSLTGAFSTIDLASVDPSHKTADLKSMAFGDNIDGAITIQGRIFGFIWAGMPKLLSLGEDGASSTTIDLNGAGAADDVLIPGDDIQELRPDGGFAFDVTNAIGSGTGLPITVGGNFQPLRGMLAESFPAQNGQTANLTGTGGGIAQGTGKINGDITTIAGDLEDGLAFSYSAGTGLTARTVTFDPKASIEGPDGVDADITVAKNMNDYLIRSARGSVKESGTITIGGNMNNSDIVAASDVDLVVIGGSMDKSTIRAGGNQLGVTIGKDMTGVGGDESLIQGKDVGAVSIGQDMKAESSIVASNDLTSLAIGRDMDNSDATAGRNIGPVTIGRDMLFSELTATTGSIASLTIGDDMEDSRAVAGVNIGPVTIGAALLGTKPALSNMLRSELYAGVDIGAISINGDLDNSDIVAFFGTIGAISIGDDITGEVGEVNIFAEAGIGNILVQDSILGDVEIVAISGGIGNITVGTKVDANPADVDGDGIFGKVATVAAGRGGDDKVRILAQQNIGDITVVVGHIQGNVLISAGVSPEVSGISAFGEVPEVVFPDQPDDLRDFAAGTAFFQLLNPPALFWANIGNIDVQAGGIFATGNQPILISATQNIGTIKTGSVVTLVDAVVASAQNIGIQAGNNIGIEGVGGIDFGGSLDARALSIDIDAGGTIYGMIVRGSMFNDVDITAGALGGLVVTGNMDGGTVEGIDITTGVISAITWSTLPAAAILVGRSMLNDISITASSIGSGGNALTVGFAGTGNVNPGSKDIYIVARGAGGNIGNITVRDQLGSQTDSGGGDVFITSEDGSIGDIVAGRIYVADVSGLIVSNIFVTAETAIGDIVAIDDPLTGIRGLVLTVNNPFGRIGDIISHGNITADGISSFIDLNTFDGSIGDLVSLVGSVSLSDITFGGSIGDIFAGKYVEIENVWLEAGSLAYDGIIGTNDVSLKDQTSVTTTDGLGRIRYDGAPKDGITSEIDYVDIDDLRVFQNVGPITAFKDVTLDDIEVGGNIGAITSLNADVWISVWDFDSDVNEFHIGGDVGNIKAFLDVKIGSAGVFNIGGWDVQIGGDVGTITTETGEIEIDDMNIVGDLGDITAFQGVDIGDLDVGGDVGNITSLNEDIYITGDTDISGSIGHLWAADYLEIDDLEVLGSIGDITAHDGIYVSDTFIGGTVGEIYGVSQGEAGVEFDNVHIMGDVGNVTGESEESDGIDWDEVVINGSVGNVFGKSGDDHGIYWDDVLIGGSVGTMTGIAQEEEGIYLYEVLIGGSVENVTGTSQDDEGVYFENVNIGGNVGIITGTSQDEEGVEFEHVIIGGNVGNITGESQEESGVDFNDVVIDGNVGNVFGKAGDDEGVDWDDVLIQGNLASITGISASTYAIDLDEVAIGGDVTGDIKALARDIYLVVNVGGSIIGDIIAVTGSIEAEELFVGGSIGDIVAGTSISGSGYITAQRGSVGNIAAYGGDIYDLVVTAGNDIGDVVALTGCIAGVHLHANRNIGDVYASKDITDYSGSEYNPSGGGDGSGGYDEKYMYTEIIAETGNIGDGLVYVGNEATARMNLPGGVVSAYGDIEAIIHAGYDLYGVWAMKPSFSTPIDATELVPGGNILDGTRITAGHDIGKIQKDAQGNIVASINPNYLENRGVIAGGAIEDDVVIIAGNNIGKIEAKLIGFGSLEIVDYVWVPSDVYSWTEDIEISIIKIQVPDNDGRLDNNDFFMFTDVDGDGIIDIPTELAEAIYEVDKKGAEGYYGGEGYIPILADSKISDPEFDKIVDWWGNHIGTTPDLSEREAFEDFINFRMGEVEIEDVDNIIIFKLEGYYGQFDIYDSFGNLNADGKPDGIFLDHYGDGNGNEQLDIDSEGNPKYGDQIVTFNYDVPNLPLVFIDHISMTLTHYDIDYDYVPVYGDVPALLTIIAQGKDPSSALINNGRAIGSIESTYDIYSNVLVEASRGGIGEVIASNNIGYQGSDDAITLKARTAIDTIYAGNYIGRPDTYMRIDVAGSGPGDIITLPMLQGNFAGTWLANNGVGVKGGIIAGAGDIRMDIDTGASIGAIQANAGLVRGDYHATGNLKSVYGSLGVQGEYIAELGSMDFVFAATGGITGDFTVGKDLSLVQSLNGDITADFTVGGSLGQISVTNGDIASEIVAGKGIGVVTAPFGNISGKVYSGGNIGQIVELADAPKGDVDITLKLVNGNTSYISSLRTTLGLEGDGYALIKTDDYFDIKIIQIRESSYDTDFVITKAGGKLELDEFFVDGDFGSLKDNKGGAADANITLVDINGTIFGTVAVDGVIGSLSAGGFGGEGSVSTNVQSGATFTYTIGGSTDTASAVGGDWRITLIEGNVISANLTRVVAPSLSFTTTSSVDNLNANLSHRDLSVDIGGDLIGDVRIHSGNLDLRTDNFSGDIEVIAGTLSLDVRGNILSGADADADGGIVDFSVGGTVDPSVGRTIKLDTDTATADVEKVTLASGQDISVAGSSSNLRTSVFVVFNDTLVLDTTVNATNGKVGDFYFSSDGNVRDIKSAIGNPINIKGVDVTGNVGDIIATGGTGCLPCGAPTAASKVVIENVHVSGFVGDIIGGKYVKNVLAQSTGLIASLFGDVLGVTVKEDIEGIWAFRNVGGTGIKGISAGGSIDEIFAGKDIQVIKAGELGSAIAGGNIKNVTVVGGIEELRAGKSVSWINAGEIGSINGGDSGTVSNVSVLGDIDLINARTVSKVTAGGNLNVFASVKASTISATSGKVIAPVLVNVSEHLR